MARVEFRAQSNALEEARSLFAPKRGWQFLPPLRLIKRQRHPNNSCSPIRSKFYGEGNKASSFGYPCLFGRMASALVKSVPTPFCGRDTVIWQRLIGWG